MTVCDRQKLIAGGLAGLRARLVQLQARGLWARLRNKR